MTKLNTVNKDVQPKQRTKKSFRDKWVSFKNRLVDRFNKGKQWVKDKLIPTIKTVYHTGKEIVGKADSYVSRASDAAGHIADAVGGEGGKQIRQVKDKVDQYHQQARDKVNEYHKKGEEIYNKGKKIYNIGRGVIQSGG